MSQQTAPTYTLRVTVTDADLDELAHVNNVVYVDWVQRAATEHWRAFTTEATRAEIAWVLLRHEIDHLAAAVRGDEVEVTTAVGHLEGLTFERLTEVRRVADGRLIAKSRTLWCPVHPATGRPRRVSAELRALFSSD